MTDQTYAPTGEPTPVRSAWDSALAPVIRGSGTLLLSGAFVPLLPAAAQSALLYFGVSVYLLGVVVGAIATVLYFRACLGTEFFDDRKVVYFDRVERLAKPTWLQASLVGTAVAAMVFGAGMTGIPSVVAAWVVVIICAFTGVRTITLSIRIWHNR